MGNEEVGAGIPILPFEFFATNCQLLGEVDGEQKDAILSVTWNSGTVLIQCVGFHPASRPVGEEIGRVLRWFVSECQLMYVLYKSVLRSRNSIRRELSKSQGRDAPLVFADRDEAGTVRSVWAQVSLDKVMDAFSQGGEYESIYAKAFVIFVFQLWEDLARPAIAEHLGADLKTVNSDLMGEWRHLRHWLIHPSEKTEQQYFDNADLLAQIPDQPQPGTAVVSTNMVNHMMGYLNSLHIVVNPHGLTPLNLIDLKGAEESGQISRLLASDKVKALYRQGRSHGER